MQPIRAFAILLLCLQILFLQSLRADLIPVTVALQNDGLDTPANLAAFGSLEYMLDPGAGPDWTTEQNNFLLQNLLVLVTTLGGDTTQIAALFAPGAVFADVLTPPLPSLTGPVVFSSAQTPADVPEPATIGLLGGALLLLSFYATRRLRNIYLHGPLQRSD